MSGLPRRRCKFSSRVAANRGAIAMNEPERLGEIDAVTLRRIDLLRGERYRDVFDVASFAVYDRKEDGTFAAFQKVFADAAQ